MTEETCRVLENNQVTKTHFVLRLASRKISFTAKPGQFVQVQCVHNGEPFLRRPFSFFDAGPNHFSILYDVVGRGTAILSQKKKKDELSVVGPLGNGFGIKKKSSVILIGGGVGVPPLYFLVKTLIKKKNVDPKNVHVFLGAINKSYLLCETEFKRLKLHVRIATDDGSRGKKGFITDAVADFFLSQRLKDVQAYACGPTPMLKTVSSLAAQYKISCQVSAEEPMACGFGACMGCIIKIKDKRLKIKTKEGHAKDSGDCFYHRYALACKEGPVFEAKQIVWD